MRETATVDTLLMLHLLVESACKGQEEADSVWTVVGC